MTPDKTRGASPIDWKALKSNSTSASVLTLRLFVIFSLLALPMTVAVDRTMVKVPADIAILLTANTFAFGAMWIFWAIIKRVRRSMNIQWGSWLRLFVVSGVGGSIQGAITGATLIIFHLESPISISTRAISGFFIVLFWLPLEAVIVYSLDNFEKIEEEIGTELVAKERTRLLQRDITSLIASSVEEGLKAELRVSAHAAEQNLDANVHAGNQEMKASDVLATLATSDIHNLADRLWKSGGDIKYEDPLKGKLRNSALRTLKTGIDVEPLNLWFTPTIATSILGTIILRNFGFHGGVVAVLLNLSVVLFTSILCEYLFRTKRVPGTQIFLIWVLLSLLISMIMKVNRSFFVNFLPANDIHRPGTPINILYFVLFVGIQLILDLAKGSLLTKSAAIDAFSHRVSLEAVRQNVINAEIAQICKRWAMQLHGRVQSDLLASSLVIDQAERSGDAAQMKSALAEAHLLLASLGEAPAPVLRSAEQELQHRVNLWNALVDISYDHTQFSSLPALIRVSDLGEILEEAISNAVRHAFASHIWITLITQSSGSVLVTVVNDGEFNGVEKSRLGSEIFSIHTQGNWSLTRDVEKELTTLTLNLH